MKAGLVCALAAVRALVRSGVRLDGRVMLAALCDEEGQMLGVKHFVEQGHADRVDAAIICEPEENHLCIAQKGVMWVRVVMHGVMAHGAMPLTGVNPAYPLARFLTGMQALEEREIARQGCHEYLGQPSITPTIVLAPRRGAGEPQNNVTPGAAEAVLDFRLIPGQDPEALVAPDAAIARSGRGRGPAAERGAGSAGAAPANAHRSRPPGGGSPGLGLGRPDRRRAHLWRRARLDGWHDPQRPKGIPIVTCGPGDIHIPHHIDEWVSLDEIWLAARLYVLAAVRYLGLAEQPLANLAAQW